MILFGAFQILKRPIADDSAAGKRLQHIEKFVVRLRVAGKFSRNLHFGCNFRNFYVVI